MTPELLLAIAALCNEPNGHYPWAQGECKKIMIQCVETYSKPLDSENYKAQTLADCFTHKERKGK
jgi:hypothetical protein